MPRAVTIRDIARRAGCSKSTVALALRESPLCATATRTRVQRVAEAMGYRRNPTLVARMAYVGTRGRKGFAGPSLAYLTDLDPRSALAAQQPGANGYLAARARAEELGSRLEFFRYGGAGPRLGQLHRILASRGIEGLVLAPCSTPQIELDLDWREFAIASVGFSIRAPRFDRVGFDHFEAMQDVCGQAHRRGFRRIALAMTADSDARVMHLARAPFLRWRADHARFACPVLMSTRDQPAAMRAWYRRHRPDCIVYYGRIDLLLRSGVPVGREVAVVTPLLDESHREFGGFNIQLSDLASACVDLVLAKLMRNERGIPAMYQTLLVHAPWIDGPTAFVPAPRRRGGRAAPA